MKSRDSRSLSQKSGKRNANTSAKVSLDRSVQHNGLIRETLTHIGAANQEQPRGLDRTLGQIIIGEFDYAQQRISELNLPSVQNVMSSIRPRGFEFPNIGFPRIFAPLAASDQSPPLNLNSKWSGLIV